MAVLPVLTYPHPLLKQKAPESIFLNSGSEKTFKDLRDTMRHHPGCVGLAAPQIGQLTRAMAVDVSASPRAGANHGLLLLLNPKITAASQWKTSREGCLSFPGLLANVKRAQKIRVEALNPAGEKVSYHCLDFEAVAIQHEIDHLDGIVFLDRIRSSQDLFERLK